MQHTQIITKINSAFNDACEEYSVYVYHKTCLGTLLCLVEKEIKHLLSKTFNEKGTYKFNISAQINTYKVTSDSIKVSSIPTDLDEPIKDLLNQYEELNEFAWSDRYVTSITIDIAKLNP